MTSEVTEWSARRILGELCDPELRRTILASFWKDGDPGARHAAVVRLAKRMNFREESIRKAPMQKKADWLFARANTPEMEECLEMALMLHHTTKRSAMLATFLDQWGIPNENGAIETDDYKPPTEEAVRQAVESVGERFDQRDVVVYLATLGLLMGGAEGEWREATWPVVNEMAPRFSDAS
jgi:hypothetical protein